VPRNDVSIDFTTEELLVLAELTDGELPAGLGLQSIDELPESLRGFARESTRRALHARRVLSGTDAEPAVVEAVANLLDVVTHPGILGIAAIQQGEVIETQFFSATPEVGVQHASIAESVHRFTPFPPGELLTRILTHVDLRPATVPGVPPFRAPLSQLVRVDESIGAYEDSAATALLESHGADASAAHAFVAALGQRRSSVTVTLIHKSSETQAEGGVLTWLDCGLAGNWVSEAVSDPDDADPMVEVRPASAEAIARELIGYLPAPFGETEGVTPTPDPVE
jgi:hypothetical protein